MIASRWYLLTAAGVLLTLLMTSSAPAAHTTSAAPPAVGVVKSRGASFLVRLDPRTLQPLRNGWRVPIGKDAAFVLSPKGTHVAATWEGRSVVVDSRNGHAVERYTGTDHWDALYWSGAELTGHIVGLYEGVCWSHGCGNEYAEAGSGDATDVAAGTVVPPGWDIRPLSTDHTAASRRHE